MQGSAIAFVVFVVAVIFLPQIESFKGTELVLTISTFLFAILVGFFLSRLNSRFDRMRDLIAKQDADWLSFYEMSIFLGKGFSKKVRELIDRYLITSYDFKLGEAYKQTARPLHNVYKELKELKISNKRNAKDIFDNAVDKLSEIEEDRNASSVLSLERLTRGQWLVLLILAAIIVFCVFVLLRQEIYSKIITVLLSTILVLILLMMRDLQNLKLSGRETGFESGQEVFEGINKLRYVHENDIQSESIPDTIKEYRQGIHEPGKTPKIKIIKNPDYKKPK